MPPRVMKPLTVNKVESMTEPGYYADGGNLYLQISPTGTKSWVFRFMLNKIRREMGLGPLHTVSLADARTKATANRNLVLDGIDPIAARDEARKENRLRVALDAAHTKTFAECATEYININRSGWKNAKHATQWERTIAIYCNETMGDIPVQNITTALVTNVLLPIWEKKAETASRLRGRIEKILDWARVSGYRTGDNPARLGGHLENVLPKVSRKARVQHQPALPHVKMGAFMVALRAEAGVAARALEFTILTAARTTETIEAQWSEIDIVKKVWTVPAIRMKSGVIHRVPLSAPALTLLREMKKLRVGDFVFPGAEKNLPQSNMAMLELLKRMDPKKQTWTDPTNGRRAVPHGFRSTFRDWAEDETNYSRAVIEKALAHAVEDEVEAAYKRTDQFERRRLLMAEWAQRCGQRKAPAKRKHA